MTPTKDRTRIPGPLSQPAGGLSVLVVDDEQVISGPVSLCLETLGHRVTEAGSAEEALAAAHNTSFDIALLDVRLGTSNGLDVMTQLASLQPRLKIIIITAYASVDIAVRAMARGAIDFLCKPFTPDQLAAAVARAAELHELESTIGLHPDRLGTGGAEADFATTSAALQDAILKARRIASTSSPLLLTGEKGAGKRVLARAVHGWSTKPEGPFLGIDCAAHSTAYVDLAIFGDSNFSNQIITAERPPLVHRAAGGTLLLAHIEALTPVSQNRLASLLKSGEFNSLEGTPIRTRDLRILTTTTTPITGALNDILADGLISLPPLRERADDIPMIAQRYLGYLRQRTGKAIFGFSVEALDTLSAYPWPGNLAELRKMVGDVVESANSPYIEKSQLPQAIREFKKGPSTRPRVGEQISLAELEAAHIRAIVANSPSLQAAANTLGIDFQALYRRRKQYGLD